MVDKYPHIEVSIEEVHAEIQKLKHRIDYAQKMNRLTTSFPNWSVREYYTRVIERLNSLVQAKIGLDKAYKVEEGKNLEILGFFCYYFANDSAGLIQHCQDNDIFLTTEVKKISTEKGIMLMGNTGRSKTLLFKAFMHNPRSSYSFVESRYIREDYKAKELISKSGIDVIRNFSSDFESSGRSMFNQSTYDLCIDDFGNEEPVKIYGDSAEVVSDVLMNRLNSNRITHLTTNLSLAEIEKRYGSRLISRLHEQMNILFFPEDTPDYRKV